MNFIFKISFIISCHILQIPNKPKFEVLKSVFHIVKKSSVFNYLPCIYFSNTLKVSKCKGKNQNSRKLVLINVPAKIVWEVSESARTKDYKSSFMDFY